MYSYLYVYPPQSRRTAPLLSHQSCRTHPLSVLHPHRSLPHLRSTRQPLHRQSNQCSTWQQSHRRQSSRHRRPPLSTSSSWHPMESHETDRTRPPNSSPRATIHPTTTSTPTGTRIPAGTETRHGTDGTTSHQVTPVRDHVPPSDSPEPPTETPGPAHQAATDRSEEDFGPLVHKVTTNVPVAPVRTVQVPTKSPRRQPSTKTSSRHICPSSKTSTHSTRFSSACSSTEAKIAHGRIAHTPTWQNRNAPAASSTPNPTTAGMATPACSDIRRHVTPGTE
jgi:hypothetical protein